MDASAGAIALAFLELLLLGEPAGRDRSQQSKGRRRFIAGGHGVKSQIMARLTGQAVSMRFSDTLEPPFFEELTSERLLIKYSRGAPVRQWERIVGRLAKSLDCVVYGWAVRAILKHNNPLSHGSLKHYNATAITSRWLA